MSIAEIVRTELDFAPKATKDTVIPPRQHTHEDLLREIIAALDKVRVARMEGRMGGLPYSQIRHVSQRFDDLTGAVFALERDQSEHGQDDQLQANKVARDLLEEARELEKIVCTAGVPAPSG